VGVHRSFRVSRSAEGTPADHFLSSRLPGWSLKRARWALRMGRVVSDQRPLDEHSLLVEGETLEVLPDPEPRERPPRPPSPPLLHLSDELLAYDKPPGLLMHPVGAEFQWGLINLAREDHPNEDLHLGHRLDRDTSGVCLVARGKESNVALKAAFKAREVQKTYWALVRGRPEWDRIELDAAIGPDQGPIRLKMALVDDGQPAKTRFRVLHRARTVSLVSCRPLTGRTHQLRLHLASLGHPIEGDRLYGQPPELFLALWEGKPYPGLRAALGHPRHCLHARAIHWKGLTVRAPMPADMARRLRRG
jgi:23S rRNA pseudouridine1911/1915/1917 synthase